MFLKTRLSGTFVTTGWFTPNVHLNGAARGESEAQITSFERGKRKNPAGDDTPHITQFNIQNTMHVPSTRTVCGTPLFLRYYGTTHRYKNTGVRLPPPLGEGQTDHLVVSLTGPYTLHGVLKFF